MADPVLPPIPQQRMAAQYTNMQACVRCGLCNSVCPTYQQSFLEYEGPRGRIAMAKALVEGHLDITDDLMAHWDTCILCDACSAICPAGVRMEPIGQSLRAAVGETKGYAHGRVMNALLRWALPNLKVLRAAVTLGGVYQRTGLGRLARSLRLEQALGLAELVEMLPPVESEPLVPSGQVWEPVGEHRATVALLAGCYMSAVFGETDRATARVLAANGCRVIVPAEQGCCGSLHAHRGELATAHELARRNIDAFERAQVDAIVVNAAGCGNTLKHYGAYLSDDPSYEAKAAVFARQGARLLRVPDGVGPAAAATSAALAGDLPGTVPLGQRTARAGSAASAAAAVTRPGAARDARALAVLRRGGYVQSDAAGVIPGATGAQAAQRRGYGGGGYRDGQPGLPRAARPGASGERRAHEGDAHCRRAGPGVPVARYD